MFDELFPLFSALSSSSGAGLSFTPKEIAAALSFAGPAMLVALLLYPLVARRLTSLNLWRLVAAVFVAVYTPVSLLPLLNDAAPPLRWGSLLTLVLIRYGTLVVAFTAVNVLVRRP